MSDIQISIGAEASQFNKSLEEAADLLKKFTNQGEITGQQIKNNFGLAQGSVTSFKDQIKLLEIEQRKANQGLREARAAVLEYNRSTEGTKISLKNAEKAFNELNRAEKASTNGLNENQKKRQQLLGTILQERNAVRSTREALENYRNGLSAVTVASNRLRQANGDLARSKGELGSAFKKTLGFANQIAGVFGMGLGVYGLVRLFKGATSTISGFDQSMRTLAAISGATGKTLEDLGRTAMLVGSSSKYGAEGVAEMMTELAKMGFATEEIQQMTSGITKLATAAHEELTPATETVANIIRAMGLEAKDTGMVVDTMALAFTQSALDLSRFRESMKYIAPIAKQANFTLADTSTILAKLADAGISGSLAGTSMRNVLSQLSDSSSALSKRLGFAVNDFEDFVSALEMMKEQGSELEDVFQVMDRRAASAFAVLLDGTKDLRELRVRFDEANGAASEMANIQMQAISYQTKLAKNAWDGFILAMDKGDGILSNMIRGALSGFSNTMNDLTFNMTRQSKEIAEQVKYYESLEGVVNSANRTNENRLAIIEQLRRTHPELIKGLDDEALSWERLAGVIRVAKKEKEAYFGVAVFGEDILRQETQLKRLKQQWHNLGDDVIEVFNMIESAGMMDSAIRQMQQAQFEADATIGVTRELKDNWRDLKGTVDNTNLSLRDFARALLLRGEMAKLKNEIEQTAEKQKEFAGITLDAAGSAELYGREIQQVSARIVAGFEQQATAAMNAGMTIKQAYSEALQNSRIETEKLLEAQIRRSEVLKKEITDMRNMGNLTLAQISTLSNLGFEYRGVELHVLALKKSLEDLDKAYEDALDANRRELRETENSLRLDQRIAEAQARIALDGIAQEERLSQIKLYYADKIAKATMHGDELTKTLELNRLQREIESQAIRGNLIRQNMQLDENAHKRRLQQMEVEKDAALQAVGSDDTGSPREAALKREMALLDVALDYEQKARDEQTKNSIARVEAEIEIIKSSRTRLTQEEIRLVADKEAEITAITEKAMQERVLAERAAITERIALDKQMFELRIALSKEEQAVKERAAQWERDLQMYQTQRIENLWQAMDLFGQTTKRIREQERKNEAERLTEQLNYIELQKKELEARLLNLKAQLASADLTEKQRNSIEQQVEVLEQGLNSLDLDSKEINEFLRRILNPEFDMSEWQNFISAMKGVSGELTGIYQGVLDERHRIAQEERALLDRRISEMQRDLDLELRLNEQGFASNVQAMLSAIEKEKQARDKALQEEKKAAQEKRRMEKVIQTINLLTAVSNVLKAESTKGLLGIATAAAGLGGLWMLWGGQSSRAKSSVQSYEKGGSFLLDGPSHARGGVPLTPRHEAQGGELVSVFNRSATKKYGSQIKSMTDAINKGEYINPSVNSYNFDTSDIRAIRKLLEKDSVTYADGYKIITKGNTTIRCRLN